VLAFLVQQKAGLGPFFRKNNGKVLTAREVHQVLAEAEINGSQISGHSFRIGAATTTAQGGVSKEEIKALNQWKSR